MKKKYTGMEWNLNRSIYFKIGMIISLAIMIKLFNIEATHFPHEQFYIEPEEGEKETPILLARINLPFPKVTIAHDPDEIEDFSSENAIAEKVSTNIEDRFLKDKYEYKYTSTNHSALPLPEEESQIEEFTPERIWDNVEHMPVFLDCTVEYEEYQDQLDCTLAMIKKIIVRKLRYPSTAKEKGIEAVVHGSFVIDKEGKVVEIEVQRTQGFGLDEAVVKVLESFPEWKPGVQNGKTVNVRMYVPIKFKLVD